MAKNKQYNYDKEFSDFFSMFNNGKIFVGLYIDFDNLWNGILDLVPEIKEKNESNKDILNKIVEKLTDVLNEILINIEKNKMNVRFIKAYADFGNLLYSKNINIIDILHKKGINTIYPYVRGNKDMSDRALIIGVIEDIFYNENVIDHIFVLTGDIDYLPLFEFISNKTEKDFSIISFKSRFNKSYEELFYLKERIIILDELLKINTEKIEKEKKQEILKDFINQNNIDINSIHINNIINKLNNKYYLRFDKNFLREYIKNNSKSDKID